ncbi:MAG: sulfate ABC transporter permease subunit CysT [Tistrella sp.]|uniref:Sulfate transport system permease protein CysT n=1 Tax=Tistrella mobilis TaxID=171437 RepID=A0A3B9IUM8_9PROT|nr:sulfate ABC transporter permease subunit CysT [Tistrella sp.]MAD35201.1 sulfate ABC transporter permease subunit CysT [Tistrella sp.]MBA76942.1 sulfate ABC transporter permease subunit CysT [Tistrella sp.]HAE50953.1 sulfate ABC transporter permease subunit CysT [Tistrella mobilis]
MRAVAGRSVRAGAGPLPGFGPALGLTLTWLSLIVLIPLAAVFVRASGLGVDEILAKAFSDRALAAYRLSFGGALIAAALSSIAGLLIAWVLVRYSFPGRRLADAMVDLPFALPTAVAGIALTALTALNGLIGAPLAAFGIRIAFTPTGVILAMVFIGLPFVVRTVQPVLEDLDREVEEAAASLGAGRRQILWRVILPALAPGLSAGFALAFARAVGEYGSVIFIAGNMPGVSEIAPLLIVTSLEQYDYAGASAIAAVMLIASFILLLIVNGLDARRRRAMEG